ncbi:MAG TPA: tripartite tricarboxylate transporter substrate-binding protein [Candidatus Binatia bacterium]|jgi:tripartite-type tricarboxylate transporter receptor subunit TctC
MRKQWITIGAAALFNFLMIAAALSQDSFYTGKAVRIIVATSAGGGYDTYSRTIARHLSKHIPGNPTVLVENMPGAGFRIGANYVYKVAKPDGLTIGHFIGGLFMQQLIGDPGIEFDAVKFEYVGAPAQDNYATGVAKSTGVTSIDQWLKSKQIIKLGGVGPGSATDDIPKVLKEAIGLPVQVVTGYKGTADVRLAFDSGEVQGVCNAWESFKSTWRKELDAKDIQILVQHVSKPHPELSNVPLDITYARNEEGRKLIRALVHTVGPTARPYVLPPGTPRDRVQILRKAFSDTMKDPEFLADAGKAKLDINPLDGAELERNVREVFNLDKALIPKAKELLK